MVTPSEAEMRNFLREYYGAEHWRVPFMRWREAFHRNAGLLIAENRIPKLKKYQRGSVSVTPFANAAQQGAASGTIPDLSDVTDDESNVAPAQSRISLWYHTDGDLQWWAGTGTVAAVLYAQLTTQSDDANDHTLEWWPDNPETDIGLDYDIRYLNEVETGTPTARHYFQDTIGPTDRVSGTWYLLDTVSDDAADATDEGAMGINRGNGTAKTPNTGFGRTEVDVEIRATGSGSALASHAVDITVTGT